MPSLLPSVDPDGLLEYSVVYTDRAVNHMSRRFQDAMNDISATLKEAYGATAVAVVPGGGHCPQFEAPVAFWQALSGFLAEL